ncbi:MAG TPA: serine/threonine-protein kinase [Gammaproteobacteria bacterium]
MKKGFWTADWFFGLVFSLLFFVLAFVVYADSFSRLETFAYDLGMRASSAEPSDRIAIIEIDDASIEAIGRWPWPRNLHAVMIDRLAAGGAKVIGATLLFSEPQRDPGLLYVEDLADFYDASSLGRYGPLPEPVDASTTESSSDIGTTNTDVAVVAVEPATVIASDDTTPANAEPVELFAPELPAELINDLVTLRERMAAANEGLDTDARLAESIASAGNVVIPFVLDEINPLGRPDTEPPAWMLANAIDGESANAITFGNVQPPIESIGMTASGLGHLVLLPDDDGALRFEPLTVRYHDVMFPSFALAVAAKSLNLQPQDIRVSGDRVTLGNLEIGTTSDLLMYNYYYNPTTNGPAFPRYSFADVFQGVIPIDRFEDKIVLIGGTALGIGNAFATPVSSNMAPVAVAAHTISALLQEDFFTRPAWANLAESGVFLLIVIYLITLLPRMKPGTAAVVSLALLLAMISVEFSLLGAENIWLKFMVPAVFLLAGHLMVTIKRARVTDMIRIRSEAEGAESNRMLGLAFQGQGQLDMAFEKFRKCPMDDSVMDLLYNLALDYERKRQHNKAGSVYAFMADHNPNYRDLKQRMKRTKAMEETVVLGGSGGHPGGTLMLDGDDIQKPMLGRYQVEKELGKGAMGVVYLGRDPKINRVVAIKTMALSQEFEEDELEDVKQRFFREAETAGRLNHPNIVTIYDAGEEHDLAYIAMEFLKGRDLVPFTKPDKLLSFEKIIDIIACSAEALDFAHQQGVVHRDIKPANMMYEPDSGSMKITDFGIARITDSSKTKTGMVLGTPSYMSPEQLSGQKVDGRSDLFSLGATFYQLLTGQLPFRADSMATLMYKIANEEQAPVTLLRPDLPERVDAVINKALEKDIGKRYQRGSEMAADVRSCVAVLAR